MSLFDDKKLLILGGGASVYGVVETAKKMGMYVICVDYYEEGVAKKIADENYNISTNDYDALLKLIEDKNIDGVFTGASEFNIQNMIKLTKMAQLPCYCSEELWILMQDKINFKKICKEYGIPVVPEYSKDIKFDYKKIINDIEQGYDSDKEIFTSYTETGFGKSEQERLCKVFKESGIKIVSGGSDNHLLLLDVSSIGITGKEAEEVLDKINITVNKNTIPGEANSVSVASGIRIGAAAMTTRGFKEAEFEIISRIMVQCLQSREDESLLNKLKGEVLEVTKKFPIY